MQRESCMYILKEWVLCKGKKAGRPDPVKSQRNSGAHPGCGCAFWRSRGCASKRSPVLRPGSKRISLCIRITWRGKRCMGLGLDSEHIGLCSWGYFLFSETGYNTLRRETQEVSTERGKKGIWSWRTQDLSSQSSLTIFLNLGKPLNLFGPQFTNPLNGNMSS